MTFSELVERLRSLDGVVVDVASEGSGAPEVAWGDVFCFAGRAADGTLAQRGMFATVVTKDYPGFDDRSALSDPEAFRLNVAVDATTFERLVGRTPRDAHEEIDIVDLAVRDQVMPHPHYARQAWISIVQPGPRTAGVVDEVLAIGLARARDRG